MFCTGGRGANAGAALLDEEDELDEDEDDPAPPKFCDGGRTCPFPMFCDGGRCPLPVPVPTPPAPPAPRFIDGGRD